EVGGAAGSIAIGHLLSAESSSESRSHPLAPPLGVEVATDQTLQLSPPVAPDRRAGPLDHLVGDLGAHNHDRFGVPRGAAVGAGRADRTASAADDDQPLASGE